MAMNHDEIERKFIDAAGALLRDGFDRIREQNRGIAATLSRHVGQGRKMALITTFDKNGMISTVCSMEQPDGGALEIFQLEPQNPPCSKRDQKLRATGATGTNTGPL
jgi:hypothetical protein